jgi:hypothetical protein
LLSTHSEAIRLQLQPLLVEMVREGAHPRLMALLLDRSQHGSTEKFGLGQPNHMLMSTGGWSQAQLIIVTSTPRLSLLMQ